MHTRVRIKKRNAQQAMRHVDDISRTMKCSSETKKKQTPSKYQSESTNEKQNNNKQTELTVSVCVNVCINIVLLSMYQLTQLRIYQHADAALIGGTNQKKNKN